MFARVRVEGSGRCLTRPEEEFDDAIAAWKESIALQPSSPDAHTSTLMTLHVSTFPHAYPMLDLASAYIVSPISRPDLALHHLR